MPETAGEAMWPGIPSSESAVLTTIATVRRETIDRANELIGQIKACRDRELNRLAQIEVATVGSAAGEAVGSESPRAVAPASHPHRVSKRRRARCRTSPEELASRGEAVLRHLVEVGEPVGLSGIRRALGLTESKAQRALALLADEGRVARIGIGSATRYRAMRQAPGDAGGPAEVPREGTLQGRVKAHLERHRRASLDELAEALREPPEPIKRECGVLLREEEIRTENRNGITVYFDGGLVDGQLDR